MKIYCGTVNGKYIFKLASVESLKREATKVLKGRRTLEPDEMVVTSHEADGTLVRERYVRQKMLAEGTVKPGPWVLVTEGGGYDECGDA